MKNHGAGFVNEWLDLFGEEPGAFLELLNCLRHLIVLDIDYAFAEEFVVLAVILEVSVQLFKGAVVLVGLFMHAQTEVAIGSVLVKNRPEEIVKGVFLLDN